MEAIVSETETTAIHPPGWKLRTTNIEVSPFWTSLFSPRSVPLAAPTPNRGTSLSPCYSYDSNDNFMLARARSSCVVSSASWSPTESSSRPNVLNYQETVRWMFLVWREVPKFPTVCSSISFGSLICTGCFSSYRQRLTCVLRLLNFSYFS